MQTKMATRPAYFWLVVLLMVCLPAVARAGPLAGDEEPFDAADEYDDSQGPLDEDDQLSDKKPNLTSTSQHFHVRLGEKVRLPCDVDDLGGYALMWKREEGDLLTAGSMLITRNPRISMENNSLLLRDIVLTDAGDYICQISTTNKDSVTHRIVILVPAKARPVPSNGLLVVGIGEPVTLTCEVTGNPVPVVTWTREGGKKFHDGRPMMQGKSITFVKTDRHHAGVYECKAENSEGEPSKASINLQITYPPEVEVEQAFISIAEGYNTELTCVVHGEPRAQVSWSKDGKAIDVDQRFVHSHAGSRHVLSINNVKRDDFGNYRCSAENRFGNAHQDIELHGTPMVMKLKRNKPLTNGIELEWVSVSQYPVLEYRLRYRPFAASPNAHRWDELILKAREMDGGAAMDTIYNHVHQLHNLNASTEYELTIQSRNMFGWSHALTTKFTTLQTEVAVASVANTSPEGKAVMPSSGPLSTSVLALVLTAALAALLW